MADTQSQPQHQSQDHDSDSHSGIKQTLAHLVSDTRSGFQDGGDSREAAATLLAAFCIAFTAAAVDIAVDSVYQFATYYTIPVIALGIGFLFVNRHLKGYA